MKQPHTIIGLVHAEWCGHCKELKPKWDEMKSKINPSQSHIEIKEVEESDTRGISELKQNHSSLEINGYPTIFKISPVGKIEYYQGEREVDSLVKWAKSPFSKKTGGRRSRRGGRKTRKHAAAVKSRKNKNKNKNKK